MSKFLKFSINTGFVSESLSFSPSRCHEFLNLNRSLRNSFTGSASPIRANEFQNAFTACKKGDVIMS